MDHRVFLNGHVRDQGEVRIVEQAVAQVSDVGEVVDLLDIDLS
jgi:osmotically-inducible protein OsmY